MDIVTRAEWGANPLHTPAGLIATPTPELWLHHTGSTGLHGASGMRSLQAGALAGGYSDIEYNYVVDTDGTVFESRGPGRNSAATADHNEHSHAVCCMGNFETQQPTDAMLDGIIAVVRDLVSRRYLAQADITGPHRDAPGNSTACCGRNLIAHIDQLNRELQGSTPTPAPKPEGGAVDIARSASGQGYWVVDSTGAVFAYGDAQYKGGANVDASGKPQKLNAPIVGMAAHHKGTGYWLVAADGGVFAYGVPYYGGMGGQHINAPVCEIAATPSGKGYWLIAEDGGVFAFGDAPYKGAPVGKVH